MRSIATLFACVLMAVAVVRPVQADDTFSQEEIMSKARGFFGSTTKGLAEAIQKVFADQGQPNAIILGEEASGAIGIGLRYGEGTLERKSGATQKVYWQGPSIGFDFGGIHVARAAGGGRVRVAGAAVAVHLLGQPEIGEVHDELADIDLVDTNLKI